MKLIFDNEEQKEKFMTEVSESLDICPEDFGLKVFTDSVGEYRCTPDGENENCRKCWENSGCEIKIEERVEVDGVKVKDSERRYLINIPPSGDYVEILGHKIYGNWNEGVKGDDKSRESFINFCRYLHRVDELERRLERVKDAIRRSARSYEDWAKDCQEQGVLTENDIRWLKGEGEIVEDPIHKPDLTTTKLNNVKEAIGKLSETAKTVSFNLDIFPKVVLDEAIRKQEELQKKLKHLQVLYDDKIYEAFKRHGYSREWVNDINNIHRIEVFESPYFGIGSYQDKIDIYCVDGVELFKVRHMYKSDIRNLGNHMHMYYTMDICHTEK